jgi:AraC-like DNA-binding protein
MRSVNDVREFLADPVGCQLTTHSFSYWYPRRGLTGFALRGTPDREQIQLLNRIMDIVITPVEDRHISIVDTGLLTTVDPLAFRTMAEYLASRWPDFGRLIIKQALIRPSGFAGAVVAGFYEVIVPNYWVQLFSEPDAGLRWLGEDAELQLSAAISSARSCARSADPVLQQLRAVLQREPQRPRLNQIAGKLGLSERTLQRRLAASGTTFLRETHLAKLEAAQSLMLASRHNLTRIAIEVGFASVQHFSALFRKHVGQSPSEWVRRRTG